MHGDGGGDTRGRGGFGTAALARSQDRDLATGDVYVQKRRVGDLARSGRDRHSGAWRDATPGSLRRIERTEE
jgi:hypothetical protein